MQRPNTLAAVARAVTNDKSEFRSALAGFLDDFHMNEPRRESMIDPEPPMTENKIYDAYLGAVAEHLARRWALEIPGWTSDARRVLHKPFFATRLEPLKAMLLAQSPLAFRKRMIFVEAEPLRRAWMPQSPASNR